MIAGAFWSLQTEGGPVRSSKVTPAPKPTAKGKRGAKENGTATTDESQPADGSVLRDACGKSFASTLEASEHMATAHPA